MNDSTYDFFYEVEEVVRSVYSIDNALNLPSKDSVVSSIETNEDVLFQWCLMTTSAEGQFTRLLNMIVDLYVTIRGHSFAASCVELYKQAMKKTLQKSRPLRTEVAEGISKSDPEP